MTATENSICARRRHPAARGPRELNAVDGRAVSFAAAETSEKSRGPLVESPHEIELLYAALGRVTEEKHPRTARLLTSSSRKVAQKVIEEAGEVALAAVKHNRRNIVRESADLLYQLAPLAPRGHSAARNLVGDAPPRRCARDRREAAEGE
jgi:phosphoribosyl-ATP pyrophosphohydrolase